jgi:hypothetical protein
MAGIGVVSQLVGFVAERFLPQYSADSVNATQNVRLNGRGEVAVSTYLNEKQALAAEGSYFVTTNPTPGTGIAGTVSGSYANTAGWFFFQNWNALGGANAYLDYLKLIPTVAPASGTNAMFAVIRDVATPLATQITTAHYTTAVPVNVNGGAGIASKCILGYQNNATASANIAPSAASAIVGRASISGIPIVNDELVLKFGGTDVGAYQGLTAVEATSTGRKVSILPPICIPPQQQVIIFPWFASNASTGMSFEFELTHIER